jgi:hypothetical protein
MQGVHRLRRVSVVKLSKSFGGLLLQACVDSKEARTVEVFADLSQGMHAKNLIEVEEIWKILGRIGL